MAFDHLSLSTRKLKRTIYISAFASLSLSSGIANVAEESVHFGWVSLHHPSAIVSYFVLGILIWSSFEYAVAARVDYTNSEGTALSRAYVAKWEEFAREWDKPETNNRLTEKAPSTNELVVWDLEKLITLDEVARNSRIATLIRSQQYLRSKIPNLSDRTHGLSESEANIKFWVFDIAAPYAIAVAAVANLYFSVSLRELFA